MAVAAAAATANEAQVWHCCWFCAGATSCTALPLSVLLYMCGDVASMSSVYMFESSSFSAAHRLLLLLLVHADLGLFL
jgi:hypothetical protein